MRRVATDRCNSSIFEVFIFIALSNDPNGLLLTLADDTELLLLVL
jgi:hypothetical protein